MPRPKIDLTGRTFGRLTVLNEAERNKHKQISWLCRCECGAETVVLGSSLRSGGTRSCGCLIRERVSKGNTRHGMFGTPIYEVWKNMIQRTSNPKNTHYIDYGGRGIAVCDRWKSFENFHADMSAGHAPGLTIDRIDNSRGYELGNCRWATAREQARNTRRSVHMTYGSRTMLLIEWAELTGLNYGTLRQRIHHGWPVERALTEGVDPARLASL